MTGCNNLRKAEMNMDVLQAMEARSSTRSYTAEPLTKEELDTLLKAGLQAPTATNRQELHITVVPGDAPVLAKLNEKLGRGGSFYYSAPTVLVISGEEAFSWTPVDAGIAVENIALAAEGLGLGSVILGCVKAILRGPDKPAWNEALKIPQGYAFEVAIAVGHKDKEKTPHTFDPEKQISYL